MTEEYWKHRSNLNKIDDKLKEMSKQILIVKNDLSVLAHKCHTSINTSPEVKPLDLKSSNERPDFHPSKPPDETPNH